MLAQLRWASWKHRHRLRMERPMGMAALGNSFTGSCNGLDLLSIHYRADASSGLQPTTG